MEGYKKLLCCLEDRLTQNDENRNAVQREVEEICSRVEGEADSLEETIFEEIHGAFDPREERIFHIVEMLNNYEEDEGKDLDSLIRMADEDLSSELKYEFKHYKWAKNFSSKHKLIITSLPLAKRAPLSINTRDTATRIGSVIDRLHEHLDRMTDAVAAAKGEIGDVCAERRKEAEELRSKINEKLEPLFTKEDSRIQELVKRLRELINGGSPDELEELAKKAKRALITLQKYALIEPSEFHKGRLKDNYDLITTENISLDHLDFEAWKPVDITPSLTSSGAVSISFSLPGDDTELLRELDVTFIVAVSVREEGQSEEDAITLTRNYSFKNLGPIYFENTFMPSATYYLKLSISYYEYYTDWSDETKFAMPEFNECCAWKKCPDNVDRNMRYSVDDNPRIATGICKDLISSCVIIGSVILPLNRITSWSIKILKSKGNNCAGIYIGVAPFDIDQNERDNFNKCGWYFDCCGSTLWSGPPHNYRGKKYGQRKGSGQYIHTGDSVGVVMDTTKGELSFVLNGVNLGVAYEGIPLDKPLLPCVFLGRMMDSIELDTSEVKENVDSSINIFNITTKSTAWDSIALAWDSVEGASFYQIEMDGSKSWDASTSNIFTKKGLLPEIEHTFRVRAIRGNSVGEWSEVVKGRTQEESFETSRWKECPDNVCAWHRYSVDEENPRIATNIGGNNSYCTIIGNTPLPLNKVTSWNIKILKSKYINGGEIHIGVAPFYIDQNENDNFKKCGWHFDCYWSQLCSGPPHNYWNKVYGPRKERGEYVHARDSVGVVMDTTKGDLSFILNGVNLGVAYEGIPLDKPLLPCVLLKYEGDSVELDLSEVRDTVVDSSIPVPSSITTKSITWDSITLTWDAVEGASFYQIEMDGSISNFITTSSFIKKGLLPDTEHTFRMRVVKEKLVSEWSDVVKGKTQKVLFETSVWKECPDNVYKNLKYSVDAKNPRIAAKTTYGYCTIIGDTPLPRNKMTSWSIKILKSKRNDGNDIFIGVAPSNIDQNVKDNFNKCGWYFNCYDSKLWSGPPHDYWKEYGPRKGRGEYVRTGDIVGVVMDTAKGGLSFIVNGVNLGAAYEGIPLDKPLVPCVILREYGDSVELVTLK